MNARQSTGSRIAAVVLLTAALFAAPLAAQDLAEGTGLVTIPVQHRVADDIAELIRPYLSNKAVLTVDVRTNSLILRDTRASADAAAELVRQLDKPVDLQSFDIAVDIYLASQEARAEGVEVQDAAALELLKSSIQLPHITLLSTTSLIATDKCPAHVATVDHQIGFQPVVETRDGRMRVQLRNFSLNQQVGQANVAFKTSLTLEPGMPLVVGGTSVMTPSTAIVLIVRATPR